MRPYHHKCRRLQFRCSLAINTGNCGKSLAVLLRTITGTIAIQSWPFDFNRGEVAGNLHAHRWLRRCATNDGLDAGGWLCSSQRPSHRRHQQNRLFTSTYVSLSHSTKRMRLITRVIPSRSQRSVPFANKGFFKNLFRARARPQSKLQRILFVGINLESVPCLSVVPLWCHSLAPLSL